MFIANRETMVMLVKACGQEIIDTAEDIIGDSKTIEDLDIWIRFNHFESPPTVEFTRQNHSRNANEVITDSFMKSH